MTNNALMQDRTVQHKRLMPVHSVEKLQSVLKRERYRADRSNSVFSLVVFSVMSSGYDESSPLAVLEDMVRNNIRLSDEAGWFDEHRLSVLLPDTVAKDARVLAEKILSFMQPLGIQVSYQILSYPSQNKYFESATDINFRQHSALMPKMSNAHEKLMWKRILDVTVSLIALIMLSPLLLAVAVLIKIVSPGPVFFTQERVGLSGKVFKFLKFRTMTVNNDVSVHSSYLKDLINGQDGDKPMVKLKNDSRIILFGNFLRRACIDELPQLINVLRGDMSLVGPRPCIPYEAQEYLNWHARRFDVVPGMTGLWQVSGKNTTTFKEMIRLDIEYTAKRSLWLDLYILAKTPLVIMDQLREIVGAKTVAVPKKAKKTKDIPLREAVKVA